MRLYSVAITALAVDATVKWVDNLVAHHDLPEVRSRSRGVARAVSWDGVVRIAIVRMLHLQLGCGVREAVSLSGALLRPSTAALSLGRWLTLAVDRVTLEQELQARLAEVLESAPRPKRGRPARRPPASSFS